MRTGNDRRRRPPRPLDARKLEDLALSYVGRFATSAAKLEAYLARKLRERGWEGDSAPQPAAIAARFVDLGYIDDEAYARSRASGLLRRGYGPRRVAQALGQAGIGEEIREAVRPDDAEARNAAVALARKRGFGPFGAVPCDRAGRERQLAAMLRAGHGFETARAVVDARSPAAAEGWASEAEES